MKVKDLIKELQNIDPELLVLVPSVLGEYDYGIVHSVKSEFLVFIDDDPHEEQLCIVINEV